MAFARRRPADPRVTPKPDGLTVTFEVTVQLDNDEAIRLANNLVDALEARRRLSSATSSR